MLEDEITAAAARQGLRPGDFFIAWDRGQFDPGKPMHELLITTTDGRRARVHLLDVAIHDRWLRVGPIEDAFKRLTRRDIVR